eukprot:scaffold11588_cov77-Skeletonema_dohrnii-CCMP3373.AAC.1
MAIKTDMPHVISLLRDVSAGDRRIYCGRRLSLSPLLHGNQSRHNAGCLTLELGRYGWSESTPQRHDDDEVLCVVDEKRFFAFSARAGKDLFLLSCACFRQHAQPIPGYPSETHVWKVNSRSKMQQAKHA